MLIKIKLQSQQMELWKLCGSPRQINFSVALFFCWDVPWFWPTRPKLNIYERCATRSIHTIIFRFLCIYFAVTLHTLMCEKEDRLQMLCFSISFPRRFYTNIIINAYLSDWSQSIVTGVVRCVSTQQLLSDNCARNGSFYSKTKTNRK